MITIRSAPRERRFPLSVPRTVFRIISCRLASTAPAQQPVQTNMSNVKYAVAVLTGESHVRSINRYVISRRSRNVLRNSQCARTGSNGPLFQ